MYMAVCRKWADAIVAAGDVDSRAPKKSQNSDTPPGQLAYIASTLLFVPTILNKRQMTLIMMESTFPGFEPFMHNVELISYALRQRYIYV